MSHTADCAMTLYAHLDPSTLKQPLVCDCDMDDDGDAMPGEEPEQDDAPSSVRTIRSTSGDVVLTGETARAYRLLQVAETGLRTAQKRKDDALRAFLEAATR